MLSLKFAIASDTGRVRKNNQDSGYASPSMLLVADGMGGAAAGDLASAVAVTQLREADERVPGEQMLDVLEQSLTQANKKIADLVAADPALDGMGTTVCGVLFDGEQAGLVHIGDSRGYLLRDGVLRRLTHDHSWVQSLIDEGRLTPEQAEVHPHRSLILKVLNGQPAHEPDFDLIDVQEGDRLLFCSDGLTGMISEAAVAELLAGDDLDEAVTELTAAANAAGGQDNITVVVGEAVPESAELDQREPITVGAVASIDIPTPAELTSIIEAIGDEPASEFEDEETARYTPTAPKSRWRGTVIVLLLAATLLTFVGWAAINYTKTKVFVGTSNEHVAIYRGVPGQFLGLKFHELYSEDATLVADLPVYYQQDVADGISVSSIEAAEATVHELALKAQHCNEVREARDQATASPSPSPSPSSSETQGPASESPSPSASATPYPNTPVDPEGC